MLALALAGQFALTIFEGTFALYAQAKFNFGPVEVGAVFVVCGLVMTVFQAGAVGFLARRMSEIYQIGAGFGLMGTGTALLATARTKFFVFAFVALLALGMAFIAPNLAALISKRGGEQQVGASLGIQNAANSLGQSLGPHGRRAFPLADERSVFIQRSIAHCARSGYRLESGRNAPSRRVRGIFRKDIRNNIVPGEC